MFEQALLSSGHQLGKRRAVAAAFTGQAAAVGALVIASMFYAEKLVPPHMVYLVAPPLAHEAPPVQPQTARTATGPSVLSPTQTPVLWHAPVSTAQRFVADAGPPELTPPTGLASGRGGSQVPATGGVFDIGAMPDAPPPAPPPAPKPAAGPIRIGGDVAQAMLVHKVLPVYPPLAKQMRLSGEVRLRGIIGRDGTIQKLEVISGHPLLVGAAIDAVKQWVYKPTTLNGEAVEVIAPIQVRFVLGS